MPFIERDQNGRVKGAYTVAQPGYAEEWAAESDPAVVTYRNPVKPPPDLEPYQFRAMLKISGNEAALSAFIDTLPEPQRSIAQSKLDYSLSFQRDNELVEQARVALGLKAEQLDALWNQAYAIK